MATRCRSISEPTVLLVPLWKTSMRYLQNNLIPRADKLN